MWQEANLFINSIIGQTDGIDKLIKHKRGLHFKKSNTVMQSDRIEIFVFDNSGDFWLLCEPIINIQSTASCSDQQFAMGESATTLRE